MADDRKKDMEERPAKNYGDDEPMLLVKNALGMYMSIPLSSMEAFMEAQKDPEYIQECAEAMKRSDAAIDRIIARSKAKRAQQSREPDEQ